MSVRILMIAGFVAALGCGASEEKVGEEWEEFVSEHNACEDADECVAIYPSCPLGCHTAVAAEHEEAAMEKAAQLVSRYERGGRACAYDCIETPPLVCESGRCSFSEGSPEE